MTIMESCIDKHKIAKNNGEIVDNLLKNSKRESFIKIRNDGIFKEFDR